MVEFTLFKIPVRVEVAFWVTLGLIGFLSNQHAQSDLLINTALFVMAAFISVLVHELGHALMIKKYKLPTQIVLSSFGGYATHPQGYLNRVQSFLVTLAGPMIQLALGGLVWCVARYIDLPDNKIVLFVNYLFFVSVFWAILNCLPILPMDGGRMLEAILGPRRIKITLLVSMITAGVMTVLAFKFGYMFMGIFMVMFAWQNYQIYEKYKGH